MNPAVVVTGVSTGIGLATARLLAGRGFHVFGSVRTAEAAAPLVAELGARFTPLLFDVTDGPAVRRAAGEVAQRLGDGRLAGLVNNAGIAVPGPLELVPAEAFRHQLEVNLVAPLVVTQAFLPLLGADPARRGAPGRIVMVSSVAGRSAAPFLGPYAASKHGLEGLSESLRRELMAYGVDVVIVGPGAVATPIWDKAEEADARIADGTVYQEPLRRMRRYALTTGRAGWPPERIAAVIHTALTAARPCVRYAPVAGRFRNWILPALLPRRFIDRFIARGLGLLPGASRPPRR
jgi:NAD(P)-dependent dehydrogenase (short-subunit alcohol dehydrogenase family)